MLLTITTTHRPASDLGYLLYKHPDKVQQFDLSFGRAHVYYPEVNEQRCTVALQLEIDPIGLVRTIKGFGKHRLLEHYVNDRPYVASSFLSVAINKVFRSAMAGTCKAKQELADTAIPLEATLGVLPCRGGEALLRRLFEPLGYEIEAVGHPLDRNFSEWGESPYFTVTIRATKRLQDLLRHLYVLIPVLDREKHYWVGDDEVQKLLQSGQDWLSEHPEKELIASRYLKRRRSLARMALEQLSAGELEMQGSISRRQFEDEMEAPISLNEQRMQAVVEVLKAAGITRVVDLGCGEGRLIRELLKIRELQEIVGLDVSNQALEYAERRLQLRDMPEMQRNRIKLMHGSAIYRDQRIAGFDAIVAVEVIEHIDADRLIGFERAVFEFARPGIGVITTPNIEFNASFENLAAGKLRHSDHRFEWSREEFASWVNGICEQFGYVAEIQGIGEAHPDYGSPTQMAVLRRLD